MKRIGMFGGTFDPPHVGHMIVATQALEQLKLDFLLMVPTNDPSYYKPDAGASAVHRLSMAQLAANMHPQIVVDSIEIRRAADPGYTVTTVEQLAAPWTELWLVLGADAWDSMPSWEPLGSYERIRRLAKVAVIPADRGPASGSPIRPGADRVLDAQNIHGVSSTWIRRLVAERRTTDFLLAPAVRQYIDAHGLYRWEE